MTHRLTLFSNSALAYRGSLAECQRLAALVNKWDSIHFDITEEFGDEGYMFADHYNILLFENDSKVMSELNDLYERTKKVGKTEKVNHRKVDYLETGLNKIIRNNYARVTQTAGEKPGKYPLSNALKTHFINYYFAEHDNEVGFKPLPYFRMSFDCKAIIDTAELLEKNNNGKVPKLTGNPFPAANEVKLHVAARSMEAAYLWVKWENLPKGKIRTLHKLLSFSKGWTGRSGYVFKDHYSETFTKLREIIGEKVRVSWMDTPENLYRQENNWYYINLSWSPEEFNQENLDKAVKAIKELIEPEVFSK